MRILGIPVPFTPQRTQKQLAPIAENRGGWWPIIRESYTGAWQQNVEVSVNSVLAFHAVFACQTLIASDISKLRVKLVAREASGIWVETTNPAYSPVLRKPNPFQTRIQFYESWVISKLQRGNAYILKVRDGRGVVVRMYVLDPSLVTPLVSPDGSVFYELRTDTLSQLAGERVVVPASEVIHDRFNCLFHPLVGTSPIFANGVAATQGLAIQSNSTKFFQNGSQPGGILTAPGAISDETAARLKEHWEANYSGNSMGKIAVLGDNLKYEPMAVKAIDAQLVEQLKWTAEVVCSTYHVPPYKIGIGAIPSYNNVQALNVEYYSQCLQSLIESIELCLDEGLATGENLGTEFDIDGLLRMDSVTQMNVLKEGVSAGLLAPDEGRRKLNLPPVKGGATPYLQQQNYSLAALDERDKQNPLGQPPEPPPANDDEDEEPPPDDEEAPDDEDEDDLDDDERALIAARRITKHLRELPR